MKLLVSALLFQSATVFGAVHETDPPTTIVPSTIVPTTIVPSTIVPTTIVPSTIVPSTIVPTTVVPTSVVPTSENPTSAFPTTEVPNSEPVIPCMDSTRSFMVDGEMKTCAWVAKENTEFRCGKGKKAFVATHCPATCDRCDKCEDAVKPFETKDGIHTCDWVRRKGTIQRCKKVGDNKTCRKTCGGCPNAHKCVDSTRPFLVNGKERTCGWVQGNRAEKCLRGFVSSHCPHTCKMCDSCKNSAARFKVKFLGRFRTCKWVNEKNTEERCEMIGDSATCPESCGGC